MLFTNHNCRFGRLSQSPHIYFTSTMHSFSGTNESRWRNLSPNLSLFWAYRHVCIFSMESTLIIGCCNQQPIDIASRPLCQSIPHNDALFPLHWNCWLIILPLVKLLHSDGPPYFLGIQQASTHQQISAKMTFPRDYWRRQLFGCVFVRLSRDTIAARKSAAIETASDSFRKHNSVFVFKFARPVPDICRLFCFIDTITA